MASSRQLTLGGRLCLAWNPAYAPGQGLANSYCNPIGPQPGIGHVWMLSSDAIQLDFSQPQQLSITSLVEGQGDSVSFPRMYVDAAVACTGTDPGDQNRAYLLTLRDSRFILAGMTDVNAQFNVRVPAAPALTFDGSNADEFYFDSLNSQTGTPHTWQSAITQLWEALPTSLAGVFPGLPIQPEGIPQNLRYQGVSAWHTIHDLLARIQLTTAYDPQADKFYIIDSPAPQPGLAATLATYEPRLLNDRFPGGSAKTRIPATIRVYFHQQAKHFGTERDTPIVENWADEGALYNVDTPTGQGEPGTVVRLFDDEPAIVDFDGTILNLAELQGRAAQRAAQWLAAKTIQIDRGSTVYKGVVPALAVPGSEVSAVLYRDFGDGMMTEITLTPDRPKLPGGGGGDGGQFSQEVGGGGRSPGDENFAAPDFARHSFPTYPRALQLVQVVSATKNPEGVYTGTVVRLDPNGNFAAATMPLEVVEPCALADSSPNAPPAIVGSIHHARLNGVANVGSGVFLPLYILDSAPSLQVAKMTADVGHNASGAADLYSGVPGAEVDTTQNITVYNRFTPVLNGEFVLVYQPPGQPLYLLVNDQYQGRLLGQANVNIANGKTGTVNIYAGAIGNEAQITAGTTQVTAINKWLGDVRRNQWVWVEADGDGWYIVGAQSGQAMLGQVQSGQANANTGQAAVGAKIQVTIYSAAPPNGTATAMSVQAVVFFAPILDSEWVWVEWDGAQFVITKGELDGGFYAVVANGDFAKGGTGKVSVNYDGGRILISSLSVQNNPLGLVPNNKQVFVGRNRTGFGLVSAEC